MILNNISNDSNIKQKYILQINISGVQISFRRLTKVGATSKFWLKLADVKRHCRKF